MGISARLEPGVLLAQADTVASCDVHVANAGGEPADVRLEVTGEAAPWAWLHPAVLSVPPGGESVARVSIRLPRSSHPPAGPLPLAVAVAPTSGTGASASAEGTLEVAPFVDLFATLTPSISPGRACAEHVLHVENRGNTTAVARLGPDAEGPLALALAPPEVTARAGATEVATVTVRPRRRLLRGPGRDLPFRVVAQPEDGPAVSVAGRMHQEPMLPRWGPGVAAALLALAVAAALLRLSVLSSEGGAGEAIGAATSPCPAEGHVAGRPGGEGRTRRPPATGYAFLYADSAGCRPLRFNPCEPLHYVLNPATAPPGGVNDVHEAVARLARATGMSFVYDGVTDEATDAMRAPYQPGRYGERWAPVLLGWAHRGSGRGDVVHPGRGRPFVVGGVFVSGVVELNVDAIVDRETRAPLPDGFGPGVTWGRVLLHELGHLAGLDHVDNPAQLMYAELNRQTSPRTDYGIGDLAGLRLLGRQAGCLAQPPLPPAPAAPGTGR